MSWIHDQDFVAALDYTIQHDSIDGPINLASPLPLPNAEFMRAMRLAWGTKISLPAPQWMLAIGTWMMRTETELVLKSRRVVPGRLIEHGFRFEHAAWPQTARDLWRRWRESPRAPKSGRGPRPPDRPPWTGCGTATPATNISPSPRTR